MCPPEAAATPPTPGYPEPVVQWGVQKGETCEDVAKSLYGNARYAVLLQRYNNVVCKAGAPLREGLTLVLPEKPTTLPDARLRSMAPDVRARPGGGGWSPAASGMPLYSNYNVNTLDKGRADVEFIDRTRVFLAPNTLVVIYGTASQTRVSKSAPAVVEVDAGEVKAALAAMRGDGGEGASTAKPVEVAVKGGGRVSASSRDTVVQRKGDRTTVAVFQGKAGVTSGGKSVDVPENHGTRFVGAAPPAPPRPLPPAPAWAGALGGLVLVAPGQKGVFDASWAPVAGAIQYRIEVERERDKPDGTTELEIVSREEVPGHITGYHGERLEIGAYRLHVRAIDREEYLGIAADHAFRIIEGRIEVGPGNVSPREIEANPYGKLRLGADPREGAAPAGGSLSSLEMALDDGPFGPVLDTIDLRLRAPRVIRLRRRGSTTVESIPVRYLEVKATVEVKPREGGLAIVARLTNVGRIDVGDRIHPSARVHLPEGVRTVALKVEADGSLSGSVAVSGTPGPTRVDVVDDRGAILGTSEAALPSAPPAAAPDTAPPVPEKPHVPQIGAYAPLWQVTPGADVLPFAPTPPLGAVVSTAMVRSQGAWTFQGQMRASGVVGPLGLDAALHTTTTDGKTADGAGWLGLRVRVLRLEGSRLEVAPAVRVGFPASAAGVPAQIEPGVALGGVARQFTWLVDFGGRLRAASDQSGTGVPVGQGFLIGTGTMDVLSWLRIHAMLDTHVVVRDAGEKRGIAGLGAGIDAGGSGYRGLSFHVSPWSDPGVGPFVAQLALGLRGLP